MNLVQSIKTRLHRPEDLAIAGIVGIGLGAVAVKLGIAALGVAVAALGFYVLVRAIMLTTLAESA